MQDTQAALARRPLPGEAALLAGLVINSFAVTMILKSDLGMSVVSSVPQVLALAFPGLSVGMWNTLAQCAWLLITALSLRAFRWGYLLSFGLAFVFGYFLDAWGLLLAFSPQSLPARIGCFAAGFFAMSLGIACMLRCGTPVLPFDTVPREFIEHKGLSVRFTRTAFDLTNLALAVAFGLIFHGKIVVVGPGTVVNALFMGTAAGYATRWLDRHFRIEPRWWPKGNK